MNTDVFVDDEGAVLLLIGEEGGDRATLFPFSDVKSAIKQIEDVLNQLRRSVRLDDWSDEAVQELIGAVDREFELFATGFGSLVRMKLTKTTADNYTYEQHDYQDNLVRKGKQELGPFRIRSKGSDRVPPPEIFVSYRDSTPMLPKDHSPITEREGK